MAGLRICTYNSHGLGTGRLEYIKTLFENHDIVLVQEHWLYESELHTFCDNISNINYHGTSGMLEHVVLSGRPYGGTIILWKGSLNFRISPLEINTKRMCGIRMVGTDVDVLLFCLYMPCDTEYIVSNLNEYNAILQEISDTSVLLGVDKIIIGGDFNTHFDRSRSLHTRALNVFMERENIKLARYDNNKDSKPFTYESKITGDKFILDYILVTDNLFPNVIKYENVYSADNFSDHTPVSLQLDIEVRMSNISDVRNSKLLWYVASNDDIEKYRHNVDIILHDIALPVDALYCRNPVCVKHNDEIQILHDNIIDACLRASNTIPKTNAVKPFKCVPGWSKAVKVHKERALFWHALWKCNNSPQTGILADIRRKTRSQYHLSLRRAKKQHKAYSSSKMSESVLSNKQRDFWIEVRKIKGTGIRMSDNIDNVNGPEDISNLFLSKYCDLYNSVSYDKGEMVDLKKSINKIITTGCADGSISDMGHSITVADIINNVKLMKCNKHDGLTGHYSDHIINGSNTLFVFLSLLFSSMLTHGCASDGLKISTLVPIPKNKRKSLNDSNNYRAIALSSVIGKLLDRIFLSKYCDSFATSDYQYGFKKQHSTVNCTFVANEIIQYYLNNSTNVYAVLLDASKAFDRVNYVKLFKLLLKRNLSPVVTRFLANLYTSQTIRVKWGNSTSDQAHVSNGVKQGGVISPILFIIYMDELLNKLCKSGIGCHVGSTYCGSLGYADDVILLAPTLQSLKKLLSICEKFAEDYDVLFNSEKSKLLLYTYNKILSDDMSIKFMNGSITQSHNEKHLGNVIGAGSNNIMVNNTVNDFYVKVNMVLSHFAHAAPHIRYNLFKTYCMSLYGCQLWDLQSKATDKFYVAWRKSTRRILGVPPHTHCNLLHRIADDKSIKLQLYGRLINFIQLMYKSSNLITNLCLKLATLGSTSNMSNNISVVSRYFNMSRTYICNNSIPYIDLMNEKNIEIEAKAEIIRELLLAKHNLNINGESFVLDCTEIDTIVTHLCTD